MFLAEQLLNSPDLLQTLSCLWMAGRMRRSDGRILIALFYGMPCFETIALASAVGQTIRKDDSQCGLLSPVSDWLPTSFILLIMVFGFK